jgi:hypothetical protein
MAIFKGWGGYKFVKNQFQFLAQALELEKLSDL